MTFTLPELPYAYDALQPYMSRETLEFHHDKHHPAYVNTGNNLLKGTELEGKSVEEVVKALLRQEPGALQQCRPALQPHPFLAVDAAQWRRRHPGRAREEDHRGPRLGRQVEGGLHPGGRHAVRLRLGVARRQGRQAHHHEDPERREPARARRARRSSASTCGSTPTTSTTATAVPTISRRSSTTS